MGILLPKPPLNVDRQLSIYLDDLTNVIQNELTKISSTAVTYDKIPAELEARAKIRRVYYDEDGFDEGGTFTISDEADYLNKVKAYEYTFYYAEISNSNGAIYVPMIRFRNEITGYSASQFDGIIGTQEAFVKLTFTRENSETKFTVSTLDKTFVTGKLKSLYGII